jgi:long-chain acyl-CoA synthetase
LAPLREGPFILIANHASYLDACVIAAAIPYRALRHCYWSGDAKLLFSRIWQRPFMRAMQVYPLDERTPLQAVATSRSLLERGDSVVWFPEGWRSPDGEIQPFMPGISRLLGQIPVPVIPVYIAGTFEAFPRDRKLPKLYPLRVTIGTPISPHAWQPLASGSDADQKVADFLRNAVLRLKADSADGKDHALGKREGPPP